jgi:hypothetical protein
VSGATAREVRGQRRRGGGRRRNGTGPLRTDTEKARYEGRDDADDNCLQVAAVHFCLPSHSGMEVSNRGSVQNIDQAVDGLEAIEGAKGSPFWDRRASRRMAVGDFPSKLASRGKKKNARQAAW